MSELDIIHKFVENVMVKYPITLNYNVFSKQMSVNTSSDNMNITFNILFDDMKYRPYYHVRVVDGDYAFSDFKCHHRDYEKYMLREFYSTEFIDTLDETLERETEKLKKGNYEYSEMSTHIFLMNLIKTVAL